MTVCTCPKPELHAVPRAADLNVANARAKAGLPLADQVWAKDTAKGLTVSHSRKTREGWATRTLFVPFAQEAWASRVVAWLEAKW